MAESVASERQLIREKLDQAVSILREQDVDLWLTFVRETSAVRDPVLSFIYGHDVTWQSAFILTREGERIAILGHYDAENVRRLDAGYAVITYHEAFSAPFVETIKRLAPHQIAVNYSTNDSHADGLPHGMYLLLQRYLADTPYVQRLVGAEAILRSLRGRKTQTEIARIRQAVGTTHGIFAHTFEYLQPGMTEKQVGDFMHTQVGALGLETSWESASCPAVNSGPDTPIGHAGPTDIVIEPGHIVHFDFGIRQNGYCSDLQRVAYVLGRGESTPPDVVVHGFQTAVKALRAAVSAMRPGVTGAAVDAVARKVITDAGYPEYKYATGHHLGRACHDGGGVLGPMWERYGATPTYPLEAGNVFAVELGLVAPGYGYIGLEEDVLVTAGGAEFLSEPQSELILMQS